MYWVWKKVNKGGQLEWSELSFPTIKLLFCERTAANKTEACKLIQDFIPIQFEAANNKYWIKKVDNDFDSQIGNASIP